MSPRMPGPADSDVAGDEGGGAEARAHVRGSSLLLVGRVLATGLNFVTQVLIVRHLSKTAFGGFAYGLSLATFGETLVTLGLDRAVTRFVPIHDERREDAKAAGVIVLVVGAVLALSAAFVVTVLAMQGTVTGSFPAGEVRATVLILVLLAPVQALDNLLVGLFAVFTQPRAIFFRRYVVAPLLRLAVVGLVLVDDAGARSLALGYLAAGALGVAAYSAVLVRALQRSGHLERFRRQRVELPVRAVLGFTVPLLSTDVVQLLIGSFPILLLGYYAQPGDVADIRAVQPIANLNQIVLLSFGVLFTPVASRLLARGRESAIGRLYWQSGATVAVLTFPLLLVSFSLAHSVSVTLFGAQYERSGDLLAILAAGQFVSAALGFNSLTLAVLGRVRQVVRINVVTAVANLALSFALIPAHGALGAAIAMGATLVLVNVLRQLDLRSTGIPAFDATYAPVYAAMVIGAISVLLLDVVVEPHLAVGLLACLPVAAAVLLIARPSIRLGDTFPELARLPVVGRVLR